MLTRNGIIAFNWCTSNISNGDSTKEDRVYKTMTGDLYAPNGFKYLNPYYYGFYPMLSNMMLIAGSGKTEATINDINLESPINDCSYVNTVVLYDNTAYDVQDYIAIITTTMVNSTNENKEVNEIILRGYMGGYYFCLAREVLATSIIVPAHSSKLLSYKITGSSNFTSNLLALYGNSIHFYRYANKNSPHETIYTYKNNVGVGSTREYLTTNPFNFCNKLRCGIGKHTKPSHLVYDLASPVFEGSQLTYQSNWKGNYNYTYNIDYGILFTSAATNISDEDIAVTELAVVNTDDIQYWIFTYQVLDEPVIIHPGETKVFELTI